MINYVKGDATQPIGEGKKVIVHICNDIGAWGAGFVIALSSKWPHVKNAYKSIEEYVLGEVQMVKVEEDTFVMNMIAQKGIRSKNNPVPVQYRALEICLSKIFTRLPPGASVHMPRIGCGLAGGKWAMVETIIENTAKLSPEIKVYVYDFDGQTKSVRKRRYHQTR